MSEQKRSTPQRSDAPTQRRRSNASPRRRPSRRGGMPQWLSGWLEHMALFFSTLGARIRRIGPRARTVMRESRARNFPESNRFLVQVFLVIGGMFPMWRSLLHERIMAHRRQRSHAAGEHEDRWRRHARRVNPFYFIGGAAVVAAIALFFSFYTLGTTVEYNGSVVDTVASAAQARKAASKLESITTETLGKSYEIAKDAIHYSTAFVRRSDVTDSTTFEQDLADELGQVTYGYSLYVDDELIGSTQYAGALDELLKQIKQVYASADTLSVDFVENVRIAEGYVPTDSVMNLGAEILNSTKSGEVTYTVVKGDTWGQIANNNGMTAAELEALNPGYDINRIHIGDALTLSNAVPYLTVKVTERQNYVEDVNYDVNYVSDSSMYQGDERVISKGLRHGRRRGGRHLCQRRGAGAHGHLVRHALRPCGRDARPRHEGAPHLVPHRQLPLAVLGPHHLALWLPQHRHPRRDEQPQGYRHRLLLWHANLRRRRRPRDLRGLQGRDGLRRHHRPQQRLCHVLRAQLVAARFRGTDGLQGPAGRQSGPQRRRQRCPLPLRHSEKRQLRQPAELSKLKSKGSHPMDGIPLILGDRTSLRALPP